MSAQAQETIASYVTDMLALEAHIQKALVGQIADLADGPYVSVVTTLKATSEAHHAALKTLAERREQTGQGISEVVKRAASSVLGLGAAAIDLVRTESEPKNLRDDYTAISLASVGYLMLYTTAEALNDTEAAELAYAHMGDYARATMTLFNVVPDAVVGFLAKEGFPPRPDVLPRVKERVEELFAAGAADR